MSNRAHRILVVDPDDKTRRIIEVSLRKAGYDPVGVGDAREALEALEDAAFDLVITETELPETSGFDLYQRVRSLPEVEGLPCIFISASHDKADRLRALELGVEDYLTKPVYVAEVRARVDLALQRRETELLAEAQAPTVSGRLRNVTLVDLFRTIEDGQKTGALRLERAGRRATVYFANGEPVDARAELLRDEEAIFRLLTWSDGEYTLKLLPSMRRPRRIQGTFTDLVVEGLNRSEQYEAVRDEVEAERSVLRVDYAELAVRVDELPAPVVELLHLFDGRRPVEAVVDQSPLGDLSTLKVVQRLLDDGLLEEVALDDDEFDRLDATADQELGDWLGHESAEDRAAREAREARRRAEEERLLTELGSLQAIQSELDERLRAAEEARELAEAASVQLRERKHDIERRLTGDHAKLTTDHPVTGFRPTPSAERMAVVARPLRNAPPSTGTTAQGTPRRERPSARPTRDEQVADWLGLSSQVDGDEASRDGDGDTFHYPALKVPDDDDTADEPSGAGRPPKERGRGFRAPRSRIDTNPRFRSDMAAESLSPELLDLRQSVDDERRRIEAARRQARDEERRATASQRALERAKSAYEELERAEELRRLQAEQSRLEAERQALMAQRERLQQELSSERAQLEREKTRLEEAAESRRRAQDQEEERLRAELEKARHEREAEEDRLSAQRAEAERLEREVERQEAALRARSSDLPAAADETVGRTSRTPTPGASSSAEDLKATPAFSPLPAVDLDAKGDEAADVGEGEAEEIDEVEGADADTAPLPAAARPPDSSAGGQGRMAAVEAARRKLLEAAERSEARLLGQSLETPDEGIPRVTQQRPPSDTPNRLATIAESKKRLSSLVQETLGGQPAGDARRADPTSRSAQPTPPTGVKAVAPPGAGGGPSSEPSPSAEGRDSASARGATPVPETPSSPGDDFAAGPPPTDRPAAGAAGGDDFEQHGFFTGEHDDLYAALYEDEIPSRRGRNLLWGGAVFVAAVAIALALVSTGTGPSDQDVDDDTAADETGPSEQELASWSASAGINGEMAAGEVAAVVSSVGEGLAVVEAFEEAAIAIDEGLETAAGPEETEGDAFDGFGGEIDGDALATAIFDDTPVDDAAMAADDDEREDDGERENGDEEPLAFVARPGDEPEDDQDDDGVGEDDAIAEAINIEEATERARDMLGTGDYGEAAAQARLVLESSPNDRRAHQILGESLLNLDEPRDAIPHLEVATRSSRPDEHTLILLGNAQLDIGDQEAAYATYRRFIELFPDREESQALRDFLASQ